MCAQFDGSFVKYWSLITLSKCWFLCLQDKKTTVRNCSWPSRREENKFNPSHPIKIKHWLCVYIVAGLIIWFICCCVQMEMRNRAEFKPVDVETNPSSKLPQQLVTNQQFKVRHYPIVSVNIFWSKMVEKMMLDTEWVSWNLYMGVKILRPYIYSYLLNPIRSHYTWTKTHRCPFTLWDMGDCSFMTLAGVASQKAWQPGMLILRQFISLPSLDRLLQSRLLSLSRLWMWSLHADLCLLHLVLNTELMIGRDVGLTPLMTAFLKMNLRLRDQMPLPPGVWCILSPQFCSMNLFHVTVKGILYTY